MGRSHTAGDGQESYEQGFMWEKKRETPEKWMEDVEEDLHCLGVRQWYRIKTSGDK